MKNKVKFSKLEMLVIILLLILIVGIAIPVISGHELFIDRVSYNVIVKGLRKYNIDGFMIIITSLSNTITVIGAVIIFTLGFLLYFKNVKEAMAIPINVIGITLINQVIKHIVKRPRPVGFKLIKQGGYSYPSGHAMVSMAFYGLIIYILNKKIKNKVFKVIVTIVLSILIILVGISRIYLGVHYLSDILTGYSLSIIYLIIITKFFEKENLFP